MSFKKQYGVFWNWNTGTLLLQPTCQNGKNMEGPPLILMSTPSVSLRAHESNVTTKRKNSATRNWDWIF